MKVALEQGETLEVAILEGDRVVGTLSLEMRSAGQAAPAARQMSASSASSSASSSRPARRERRGGRRVISPEARAKMAEAQRRRWAKYRGERVK